jgi:hypothetical protein
VQVRGGGVAVADQLRQWGQQVRARREHPGQGALGQVEPVVGQRGDDPVRGPAQHELLHQQPGQDPVVNRPLPMALGTGGATSTPRTGQPQLRR